MGVDVSTYRIRIGCNRYSCGNDVIQVLVTINTSIARQIGCMLIILAIGVLALLNCLQFVLEGSYGFSDRIAVTTGLIYTTLWRFCYRKTCSMDNLVGVAWFIVLLLLAAGIEPNPGPHCETTSMDWVSAMANSAITNFVLQFVAFVTSFRGKFRAKEEDKMTQPQCLSKEEGKPPAKTIPHSSYFLGNKGAHMFYGNPHNKGDTTLTPYTLDMIEKGVQDTIGFITITEVIKGERYKKIGTGFRVGESCFMTAYHVFREHIDKLVKAIIYYTPECSPDLLTRLGFENENMDITKEEAVKRFLHKNAVDIPLLLNCLGSDVTEIVSSRMNGVWERTFIVEFLHHGQFTVSWKIPFGHESSDILILHLVKKEDQQCMPRPLFLEEKFEEHHKSCLVRYITEGNPRIILDTGCKIYTNDEELEKQVNLAIQWWTSVFPDEKDNISYLECSKAHDKDTGVVILRAAASFVYGSSGSPMVYLKQGHPYAGMIYQGGFPKFYYNDEETYNARIKEKTQMEIDNGALFERCTTIEKLAKLLTVFNKLELRKNLFSEELLHRHIVMEEEINDIRRSDISETLSIRKSMIAGYTKRALSQWEEDEKQFIETTASRHVCLEIDNANILTIVGASGSGKSFCMHHAALMLQRQGYSLFVIRDCIEIELSFQQGKKQLFLVDDPIGEDEIDAKKMEKWKHNNVNLKRMAKDSIKLMMTVRKEIINSIKKNNLIFQTKTIDLHSKKLEMKLVEKLQYFEKAKSRMKIQVPHDVHVWELIRNCNLHNFVLLVHMYCTDIYFRQNPSFLFEEPLGAFKSRLEQMWEYNNKQFGGLLLCAKNDNVLHSGIFDPFDSFFIKEKEEAKDFLGKLSINCDLELVGNELDKLKGVYIHKKQFGYTLTHSSFKNVILYVVAKQYPNFVIDHCSTDFCLDRCYLSRKQTARPIQRDDKYKIEVPENIEGFLASKFIVTLTDHREQAAKMFANSFFYDAQFLRLIHSAIEQHSIKDQFRNEILYQVFCNACIAKATDIRNELRSMFDELNSHCFNGLTPLIASSYSEDIDFIRILLSSKADVNVLGVLEYKTTALCVASKLGNMSLVKLLIQEGANINLSDGIGRTPLACSIAHNQKRIMDFLLKEGADVNICGEGQQSDVPLTVASKQGKTEIMKTLICHNATVNEFDGNGRTSITLAVYGNHEDVLKFLLHQNADVNLCGDQKQSSTPLYASCETGNIMYTRILLKHNAKVNKLNGRGNTPIAVAALNNHFDMVELLIEHNADVNLCGDQEQSYTPLHAACQEGNINIAHILLTHKADVNSLNGMGMTSMTAAAAYNHIDSVKLLIEHNADVNLCGDQEQSCTPLYAACQNGNIDIVHILLTHQADVDSLNGMGRTSMTVAAAKNHTDTVKLLIEHNADVNLCGDQEQSCTPLFVACQEGNIDIVHILLTHQPDVNLLYGMGITSMTTAAINNHIDTVKLLIEHNADVNLCGDHEQSCTPLFAACLKGNMEIVHILLSHQADVNSLNGMGMTSMTAAAEHNHIDTVKLLIEHNADVNLCVDQEQSCTPLNAACQKGNIDIVYILLTHQADVNSLNGMGMTSMTVAAAHNHIDTVKLLIEHNADVNLCGDQEQSCIHYMLHVRRVTLILYTYC